MKNSLRIASMLLSALAVVAGADYAFAQRRQIVKYLAKETKAAKGVKIPSVINPQLSLQMQQRVAQFSDFLVHETLQQSAAATTTFPQRNLSVPGSTELLPAGMTTPTARLETPSSRVVKTPDFESPGSSAKPQTIEDHIARLETNLALLEEYVYTHDNKLPNLRAEGEGADLRRQVKEDIRFLFRVDLGVEENMFFMLVKRYHHLGEVHQQQVSREYAQLRTEQRRQLAAQRMEVSTIARQLRQERQAQEVDETKQKPTSNAEYYWHRHKEQQQMLWRQMKQVRLQDKEWKVQPEDIVLDPAENAEKAATLSEGQFAFPGNVTTDEYIDQLLRFYNQLDPFGMGTIK